MKNPKPSVDTDVPGGAMMSALMTGCDVEARMLFLAGGIDESTAYRFVFAMKMLDKTPGPIHVILDSPGGSIWDGMAIYDAIRTSRNPVVIEAMGIIASAAVPLLLAGTVRFIAPNSRLMVHNGSWELGRCTTPELMSSAKEMEASNKRYHEIIATRTGRSIKDVEAWCREETWFSADEAIKNGFADRVLDTRPIPATFDIGVDEVRAALGLAPLAAAAIPAPITPFEKKLAAKLKAKKAKAKKAKKGRRSSITSVSK
jgi:ATP-dependent Clp endopeptidase proteolytic subunit ClpP